MVQELKHKPEMMLSTKIMILSFYTRNHKPCRVSSPFSPLLTKSQRLNLISAGCLYLKHMMNRNSSWNCFDPIRTQPYPSLNMLKLSYLKDLWGTFLETRILKWSNKFNSTIAKKNSWKVRIRHFWTEKGERATCLCSHVIKIFHQRYVTSVWARISAMRRSAACCSRATYTVARHYISQFGNGSTERYQR